MISLIVYDDYNQAFHGHKFNISYTTFYYVALLPTTVIVLQSVCLAYAGSFLIMFITTVAKISSRQKISFYESQISITTQCQI